MMVFRRWLRAQSQRESNEQASMTSFWKRHHSKALRKTNAFRWHHSEKHRWYHSEASMTSEKASNRELFIDAFSEWCYLCSCSTLFLMSSMLFRMCTRNHLRRFAKHPKLPFSWKIMSFSNLVFVICELKCRKSTPAASRHTREQCIIVKMCSNCAGPDTFRPRRKSAKCPESSVLRLVGNQF